MRITYLLILLAISFAEVSCAKEPAAKFCSSVSAGKEPFVAIVDAAQGLAYGPITLRDAAGSWSDRDKAYSVKTGYVLVTSKTGVELSSLSNTSAFASYEKTAARCAKTNEYEIVVWLPASAKQSLPYHLDIDLPSIQLFGADGHDRPLPAKFDLRLSGNVTTFR